MTDDVIILLSVFILFSVIMLLIFCSLTQQAAELQELVSTLNIILTTLVARFFFFSFGILKRQVNNLES